MQNVSFFRLPILWMLMGPPAFRQVGSRGAMASVEGSFDFWNFFQVAWWGFWGLVALHELFRERRWIRSFLQSIGSVKIWIGLWVAALYLSCLVSPRMVFSLANAGLLTMLVLAAADLGIKLYSGHLSVRRLLWLTLAVIVGLLLLVVALIIVKPAMVNQPGFQGFQMRIRGGEVAYTPTLAAAAMGLGAYFFFTAKSTTARCISAGIILMGLLFIDLSKTRSAYAGVLGGIGVFVWQWFDMRLNAERLMLGVTLAAIGACGIFLLADGSEMAANFVEKVFITLKRDEQTISTLNGRTHAWDLLWNAAAGQPLGLGYIAGPRNLLQSPAAIDYLGVDSFGNAHSAYWEVFSGAGYLGFVAFVMLIARIGAKAVVGEHKRALIPLHALLIVLLLEGYTESGLVMPFQQTCVLFWIIVAALTAPRFGEQIPPSRGYLEASQARTSLPSRKIRRSRTRRRQPVRSR